MFTRFNKSFEPTFYPDRLDEPAKLKKPAKIFCCSVADLFASWTKEEWTKQILNKIREYPQHDFQLLTKNPERIELFDVPKHCWVGATCNNTEDYENAVRHIAAVDCKVRFISFEPLLGRIKKTSFPGIDWIIVGKLTGSKRMPLNPEWVAQLITEAKAQGKPIFIKNNIGWPEKIQEYPGG